MGCNFDKQPDLADAIKAFALQWSAWWKEIYPIQDNDADPD